MSDQVIFYIAEAIKHAGGPSKVSGLFGVSVQAACFYRDGKRPLPTKCAVALEHATRGEFICERMVPDARWVRVPDASWPYGQGRPLLDETTAEGVLAVAILPASAATEPAGQIPAAEPSMWPLSTDRRAETRTEGAPAAGEEVRDAA